MQLSRHVVSSDDPNNLVITVKDRPGPGGDCHHYEISNFDLRTNPSYNDRMYVDSLEEVEIFFQQGNPAEGFNGVTIEALLAICEHRLLGCQEGPYKSEENAQALLGISHALHSLHKRTVRLATDKVVTEIKATMGLLPTDS
ncbi:hypothetical protein D3C85_128100 [compost metagenome]